MTEAVIVATARSPIGRAAKGSLVDLRPDDMSAQIVRALMAKVPQVSGIRHGRGPHHGVRPARRRGRLQHRTRRRDPRRPPRGRPGRHRQPVLLVEPADHPHGCSRDQGGRGRLLHLGRRRGRQPLRLGRLRHGPERDLQGPSGERTRCSARRAAPTVWTPPEGLPDIYIAMGQTAENVVQTEGVTPRGDGRAFAACSQQLAVRPRRERLLRATRSRRSPCPTAPSSPRTTARARAPPPRAWRAAEAGVPPRRHVTAGNACPLNDGAAAVLVMSDTKAKALGLTPLARIVSSGVSALEPRDHGPRPDRGQSARRSAAPA